MKHLFTGVLGVAAWLTASGAQAQPFGTRGQLSVSAERLFGVTHSVVSEDISPNFSAPQLATASSQTDSVNLLSTPRAAVYNAPRLAFDYFVANHLSLGGAASYAFVAQRSGGVGGLAGRVGYASMFTESAGIWPRAGLTYERFSGALYPDAHYVALTVEAPFVLSPTPRVAFTVGPTFDLGLSGRGMYGTSERVTELGLQGGLLVYLL